jgi:thiol-disulfide isomerase/thioredoxin
MVAGYAALAAAIVVAVVAGFLLLRGGGDDSSQQGDSLDAGQVRSALGDPTPQPNTGPLSPARPEEGKPAPDFALIDARSPGTIHKLSDYRGKVVVVNWFASWCGPCQREIPELNTAQQNLGDQLVVLGVDYMEDAGPATSILDQFKASYPAVLDSVGAVAEQYRVGSGGKGIPWSFVVDKDGVLRATIIGEATPARLSDALSKAGIAYKSN